MTRSSLLIFLASLFLLTGCPAKHLRTNGVFSVGPDQPSRELTLIAQVYYQTPPQGFHPAEFKWDFEKETAGHASFIVFDENNFNQDLMHTDFYFTLADITIQKTDQKITYQGRLVSQQDPGLWIDVTVEEYEAKMEDKTKEFYFDRRDATLTLYKESEILGRYTGATMDLKRWERIQP